MGSGPTSLDVARRSPTHPHSDAPTLFDAPTNVGASGPDTRFYSWSPPKPKGYRGSRFSGRNRFSMEFPNSSYVSMISVSVALDGSRRVAGKAWNHNGLENRRSPFSRETKTRQTSGPARTLDGRGTVEDPRWSGDRRGPSKVGGPSRTLDGRGVPRVSGTREMGDAEREADSCV